MCCKKLFFWTHFNNMECYSDPHVWHHHLQDVPWLCTHHITSTYQELDWPLAGTPDLVALASTIGSMGPHQGTVGWFNTYCVMFYDIHSYLSSWWLSMGWISRLKQILVENHHVLWGLVVPRYTGSTWPADQDGGPTVGKGAAGKVKGKEPACFGPMPFMAWKKLKEDMDILLHVLLI